MVIYTAVFLCVWTSLMAIVSVQTRRCNEAESRLNKHEWENRCRCVVSNEHERVFLTVYINIFKLSCRLWAGKILQPPGFL